VVDEPFQHYNGSAQVFGEELGNCRFVWVADLLPNELKGHVAMMMEKGLSVINATMEHSTMTR